MKPELQRIAIAEACGWNEKPIPSHKEAGWGYSPKFPAWTFVWHLPDYLNDLNAMHEAEKTLTSLVDQLTYLNKLSPIQSRWTLATANASQRAEAFLKTIGKWEDS